MGDTVKQRFAELEDSCHEHSETCQASHGCVELPMTSHTSHVTTVERLGRIFGDFADKHAADLEIVKAPQGEREQALRRRMKDLAYSTSSVWRSTSAIRPSSEAGGAGQLGAPRWGGGLVFRAGLPESADASRAAQAAGVLKKAHASSANDQGALDTSHGPRRLLRADARGVGQSAPCPRQI